MMEVRQDQLNELNEGDKITLLIENGVGSVVARQARYHSHSREKFAQYNNCLCLKYVLKRKRKVSGNWFTNNTIAVAKGWQEIKEDKPSKNGAITYMCFDQKRFETKLTQLSDVIYHQEEVSYI